MLILFDGARAVIEYALSLDCHHGRSRREKTCRATWSFADVLPARAKLHVRLNFSIRRLWLRNLQTAVVLRPSPPQIFSPLLNNLLVSINTSLTHLQLYRCSKMRRLVRMFCKSLRKWRPNAASSMSAEAGVMAAKTGMKQRDKMAKSERAAEQALGCLAGRQQPPHSVEDLIYLVLPSSVTKTLRTDRNTRYRIADLTTELECPVPCLKIETRWTCDWWFESAIELNYVASYISASLHLPAEVR